VAISAGRSGDPVAFHGIADTGATYTAAVFTQSGKVAAVGDEISIGITLDDIDPGGKVAINYWNEVAFHGSVYIESEDPRPIRAVSISDGLDTLVVAREDTNLPDETPLKFITESGGVAINDIGEVAFHGRTVDPASDVLLPAVFTSNGLVARAGFELPDDTMLENINVHGGVAINLFGEVAFLGYIRNPNPGVARGIPAVFTQYGLIAKESDILPDGSQLDNINTNAGVAINLFGDVVFHGRTGGEEAVFTQNGLVAKVGDILDDDTTLSEISDRAGVAINPYGREVVFLGKADSNNAVFVGQAPLPPAPEGDKTDSE
jgi:hypothetical protein